MVIKTGRKLHSDRSFWWNGNGSRGKDRLHFLSWQQSILGRHSQTQLLLKDSLEQMLEAVSSPWVLQFTSLIKPEPRGLGGGEGQVIDTMSGRQKRDLRRDSRIITVKDWMCLPRTARMSAFLSPYFRGLFYWVP